MKVFIATKRGQGIRNNDFSHTLDGELVKYGFECDNETVDGHCGCKRSMCGFESQKATTTFMVVDIPITSPEFERRYFMSERNAGWLRETTKGKELETFRNVAKELLRLANQFPLNIPLEKRGNRIQTRTVT
jgi:hypothetical protein